MSRRRVLNIVSRKKCDNMMPRVVNADGTNQLGPLADQTDALVCLFVPNARVTRTSITNPAVRNVSDTYAVGYREKVAITVNGGGTFMWRRIVFMLKGQDLRQAMDSDGTGTVAQQLYWQTTEGGCNRVIGPLPEGQNSNEELTSYVFKGQVAVDWNNYFTAPVDTRRVTVRSDRTRVIRPGNETGAARLYSMWYPIRRSIIYEDDMESDVVGDKAYSTAGLRGVGDMYILDMMGIITGGGDIPVTTYTFNPEGSYYWHER
jgi:hypothetical protein